MSLRPWCEFTSELITCVGFLNPIMKLLGREPLALLSNLVTLRFVFIPLFLGVFESIDSAIRDDIDGL
jgi:hypothetical protein